MVYGSVLGVTTAANTVTRKISMRRHDQSRSWRTRWARLRITMMSGNSKDRPNSSMTRVTKPRYCAMSRRA